MKSKEKQSSSLEPGTLNPEPGTLNPESKIDCVIFYGIILLLIFAPLAFGSVHVWYRGHPLEYGLITD